MICLEELLQGDTIARLPCLCIYHKRYEAAAGPAQPHPRGLFPAGSGGQGQTLFASYLLLNDLPYPPPLHPPLDSERGGGRGPQTCRVQGRVELPGWRDLLGRPVRAATGGRRLGSHRAKNSHLRRADSPSASPGLIFPHGPLRSAGCSPSPVRGSMEQCACRPVPAPSPRGPGGRNSHHLRAHSSESCYN